MTQPRASLEIERALAEAGITLVVEQHGTQTLLSGAVNTEGDREAALDIALAILGDPAAIDDDITVSGALGGEMQEVTLSETDLEGLPGADADLEEYEAMEAGDFTDQPTLRSPDDAQSASLSDPDIDLDSHTADLTSDGSHVYVPPTDPVGRNEEVYGGFSGSSLESLQVPRSSDGRLGDEAIRDAVMEALRNDAATSGLSLEVEVGNGVVRLFGAAADIDDVESAEEVAARVPGVVEVIEELRIEGPGTVDEE